MGPKRRQIVPRNGKRKRIAVLARSAAATRGYLKLGSLQFPCSLGRSGCRARKREGDGATPIGGWPLSSVLYRDDRMPRPRTPLPARPLRPSDGWCDEPRDRNYNRFVRHPYPASAERLWRQDGLYDIIVILAHNFRPRLRRGGSAIFLHVAGAGYSPTEGCIALQRNHLMALIERTSIKPVLEILPTRRCRPLQKSARSFHSGRHRSTNRGWRARCCGGTPMERGAPPQTAYQ